MYKGAIFSGFVCILVFIKAGQLVKSGREFKETLAEDMIAIFLSSEGMEFGQNIGYV
jgi:hypothetical protein